MESNLPDDQHESPETWQKYVSRELFNDLRQKGQLFDFKIIAGHKEFDAHKLLLAVDSDYFRAMFTHDSKELQENKVELRDIDPEAMESLLQFTYTGNIELTEENVEQVLLGASMLQIQAVQDLCALFIEKRLDCSNCLGVLVLAERVNLKNLATTALAWCLNNFLTVTNEQEFIELELPVLKRLLSHDKLNVDDESYVLEAIKKWTDADLDKRRVHLKDLLRLVRFAHIDPICLVGINLYEPIRSSTECRDLIDLAKDFFILKNHPDAQAPVRKCFNTTARFSHKRQRLYAVGGWTDQFRSLASAEMYNPNEDCWNPISPMALRRCGVGLVTLNDSIYAVGGHDGINYLNSIERYDTNREEWFRDVADMRYVRTSVGVAQLDGYIYAIGGQISAGATDKVERYDPAEDKWTDCAPLGKRRLGAGVTTCKGYIYVMGGSDGTTILDSVERYDPETDSWSYVASMSTPRKHLGSCCSKDIIYAVGGRSDQCELASAEIYNPYSNTWSSIAPMRDSRCGIGLVELAGKVVAIGGSNQDIHLSRVEAYDPETGAWSTRAAMKACRLAGGMTVHPSA